MTSCVNLMLGFIALTKEEVYSDVPLGDWLM